MTTVNWLAKRQSQKWY